MRYDKQAKEKIATRQLIAEEWLIGVLACENIEVDFVFYMPIPKSFSLSRKAAIEGTPDNRNHDVDNLAKYYLDCMKGLIYPDDRYVWALDACKVYSSEPRIEVTVTW